MKRFFWTVIGMMLLAGCSSFGAGTSPAPVVPSIPAGNGTEISAGEDATTAAATKAPSAPATRTLSPATATRPITATLLPGVPTVTAYAPGVDPTRATAAPARATPTPVVENPVFERFAVETGDRVTPGDPVTLSWQVQHAPELTLCYGYYGLPDKASDPFSVADEECVARVPQSVEAYTLTLAPPAGGEGPFYYVVFKLWAMNGAPDGEGGLQYPFKEDIAYRTLSMPCPYQWFHALTVDWCAAQPAQVYPGAVAQRFERGMALYRPAHGVMPSEVLVLYDDGRVISAMGALVEAPPTDLDVPDGMQPPAPEFYSLWERGSGNSYVRALRENLGWATGAPGTFAHRQQCTLRLWDEAEYCYLTGPDGTLYRIDRGSFSWLIP